MSFPADLLGVPAQHVVDAVIALTVVEAAVLVGYHRRTGRGVAPGDFVVNLIAGLALMLTLRGALAGSGWLWLGGWLALAGLAHGWDLRRRWRR